jgi:GT2 family glycosyltransferase
MKISIVMTYFNRRRQLLNTLESIALYGKPEIIVVDDGSSETIDDIKGITLIRIEPKDKWYFNTCIPFNIGFSQAKGDVIIMQNAECVHTGDVLRFAESLTNGHLFSFGAYSLDYDLPDIKNIKERILKEPQRIQVNHHGWYNHSRYRPVAYHFCNAITKKDLKMIGGFDERYAPGVAHEDDEIITRIKRAGIKIKFIDDPFVVHQKHERTDYRKYKGHCERNKAFFNNVTLKETLIKPPENKHYV